MACTILLELKVKPECIDDTIAGLTGMLPETRQFEGCIEVYAHQDQDNPTTILAIQKWESRAAYKKYFAWRTETGTIDALGAWISEPPTLRYFDKKA